MDGGGNGDDDDNDSEGGVGILHQKLTSASSALQGLLRKIGAGLDDLLPSSAMGSASSSHQSGRLKKNLSGLRADGEEGKQRVALSTAANMCKKLPSDASDFVMEAVPLLTNLLQYHDAKVLEHASVCLTRIAESFASSPDKLDELCNHGLVAQSAALISTSNSGGGQSSLSTPTYTGLIRLLSTCASGSPLGAKTAVSRDKWHS